MVIIGAGQAGLSVSHELSGAGVEHLVLEKSKVGNSWRTRWDSFCLVTPNWTVQLPGGEYAGDDPDGFMPKGGIAGHLEKYAASFQAPVMEGVWVTGLETAPNAGMIIRSPAGDIHAETVVLATGAYKKPYRPPGAATLPPWIHAIDSEGYTNPDDLPQGRVLVVGSGQTGCQIAEELNEAGREVLVACGRAPWGPRRFEGRDIVSWILETPLMEQTLADLPHPAARLIANIQGTGRGGGHDLNYRTLLGSGVGLAGHFLGVEEDHAYFASDLRDSVAFGDARYADFTDLIRKSRIERSEPVPEFPPPPPFDHDGPERMSLKGCGAVIFTSGFRPDYARWVHFPGAFDDMGFPIQRDGASLVVPNLYFIGTHFLRKRKSSLLFGVGEDAAIVAEKIAEDIG
jgi:putative flavoprotein involved in K+ transport